MLAERYDLVWWNGLVSADNEFGCVCRSYLRVMPAHDAKVAATADLSVAAGTHDAMLAAKRLLEAP